MSNRRKTGGKDFVKGVSGNPAGKPPLPPAIRQAWRLTKEEFIEQLCEIWKMPVSEVEKESRRTDISVGRLIVLKLVMMSSEDSKARDCLFERLLGKVSNDIKVRGELNADTLYGIVAQASKDRGLQQL